MCSALTSTTTASASGLITTAPKGGLLATLTGPRKPLTNRAILRSALRRPLGSRRVLGLIHWQALKLWTKKVSYRPRPAPPSQEVSGQ